VPFEDKVTCTLLHMEPGVKGCGVGSAGYALEMLKATERVGPMPHNALSVPEEATVIVIVCDVVRGRTESKVESPCCGLGEGRCLQDADCAATTRD